MPDQRKYDLEERTFRFAKDCRDFTRSLRKTLDNIEYIKQLVRSSGSQAANYIEAIEALSKKDFVLRIKICIKEKKESGLWIRLLETTLDKSLEKEKLRLLQECLELRKIFGSILSKSTAFKKTSV
jgi:four helix bundle protein